MKLISIEVNIILNYFIGNVLKKLGRNEEAIKDYSRAIEINPQKDEAYFSRGL